jgi:hypothetical protein
VVALRLEGRLPDQQLVQQHADAPPVDAKTGAAALQHLWRLSSKTGKHLCTKTSYRFSYVSAHMV